MRQVDIESAANHLSQIISELAPGEVAVLTRHKRPVAELRMLRHTGQRRTSRSHLAQLTEKMEKPNWRKAARNRKKLLGCDRGKVVISPAFFEPLTETELAEWEHPIE